MARRVTFTIGLTVPDGAEGLAVEELLQEVAEMNDGDFRSFCAATDAPDEETDDSFGVGGVYEEWEAPEDGPRDVDGRVEVNWSC